METTPRWLVAMLSGMCLALVYLLYGQLHSRAELGARIDETRSRRAALTARADSLDERLAETEAALEAAREALDRAEKERVRTRALVRENRLEHRRLAGRLSGDLGEQQSELVSLERTVEGVTAGLTSNRQQVDRAVGDLREQGRLIARNRAGLQELRSRGERDFLEFELRESPAFERFGPVALRLEDADAGRQRYTLTLIADDAVVEKKDRTLLEPVSFYSRGTRELREIVVFRIEENGVAGYLSLPRAPARPAAVARN